MRWFEIDSRLRSKALRAAKRNTEPMADFSSEGAYYENLQELYEYYYKKYRKQFKKGTLVGRL